MLHNLSYKKNVLITTGWDPSRSCPLCSTVKVKIKTWEEFRHAKPSPQNIFPNSKYMNLRDFLILRQCFSINTINYSINPEWISAPWTLVIVTWTHENDWPPQIAAMSLPVPWRSHFLFLAFNLLPTVLHSMPLFLALKQTLNNRSSFLQVTHSLEVFTCWVLPIIARASAISFWLTPQRFATFVWHLWWTFMPHAERKNKRCKENKE